MNQDEEQLDLGSRSKLHPTDVPVRGWLLFFCLALTILGPIEAARALSHLTNHLLIGYYGVMMVTSVLAGSFIWMRKPNAFFWLGFNLLLRSIYVLLMSWVGIDLLHRDARNGAMTSATAFISAGIEVCIILLICLYFRRSTRVYATLGRNM